MNTITTEGLGHNKAPADEAFADSADALATTANAWLESVPEIEDEEQAKRAVDFLDRLRAEIKATEAARKEAKEPFRQAGIAVDARYNPIKAKLKIIQDLFKPKVTAWELKQQKIRDEERRVADEKAMKLLQEAEDAKKAAEAALSHPEGADAVGAAITAAEAETAAETAMKQSETTNNAKGGTKGNYGAKKTSLRTTHSADITDYSALLEFCKYHPRIRETLKQIAGEWARSPEQRKIPLPGVKHVTSESV